MAFIVLFIFIYYDTNLLPVGKGLPCTHLVIYLIKFVDKIHIQFAWSIPATLCTGTLYIFLISSEVIFFPCMSTIFIFCIHIVKFTCVVITKQQPGSYSMLGRMFCGRIGGYSFYS